MKKDIIITLQAEMQMSSHGQGFDQQLASITNFKELMRKEWKTVLLIGVSLLSIVGITIYLGLVSSTRSEDYSFTEIVDDLEEIKDI